MWYCDVALGTTFVIIKPKSMSSNYYPSTDLSIEKQQRRHLINIGLALVFLFIIFTSASAQNLPTKAQGANSQRQKEGQDLINKLNGKLKATRSAQATTTATGTVQIPQKASKPNLSLPKSNPPKTNTQSVVPKKKTSTTPDLISSTPPKPVSPKQLVAPPSRKINGTSPAARAAQISPQNAANRLTPANKAAQMNPANKTGIPTAKKVEATKKTRPLRDIKYKRENYKAKRNNG